MVMQFGQIVLGPPGSGKTTYCRVVSDLLKDLGRKVALINLDPGNDELPYSVSINILDLIDVNEVMETQNVGPNGALVYCMEFLETNLEWLIDKVSALGDHYLIFDFPGQAELYTHHSMVRKILAGLEKADIRLCAVYLVDAHYATDAGKYVSALLLVLNSMLQMEIATVNVLSKVDAVEHYGSLQFGLEFYTEVLDLDYLLGALDEAPLTRRYQALNKAVADVVTDYSLVSFLPMSVDSRATLLAVMKAVDKANGYVFGADEERNIQRLLSCAVGAEWDAERFGEVRDRFMASDKEEEGEDILKVIAQQNYKT